MVQDNHWNQKGQLRSHDLMSTSDPPGKEQQVRKSEEKGLVQWKYSRC